MRLEDKARAREDDTGSAAGPCSAICLFGPLSARQMQHAYSIGWVSLCTVTTTDTSVIAFGEDVEATDYISCHDYLFSTAQSALGPSREKPSIIPDSWSRPADLNWSCPVLDAHVISPLQRHVL